MLLPIIQSIDDVTARQLCSGCGACAGLAPETFEMIDTLDFGRRPVRRDGACRPSDDSTSRHLLGICPGIGLSHRRPWPDDSIASLRAGWGPVLEVHEGFATDPEIRHAGSSGGVATALAIGGLDSGDLAGVLHVRARRDAPILNEAVVSTTRNELIDATGSRYAPASPLEALPDVMAAPGKCAVIGKPCDIAALAAAEKADPRLAEKIGVRIAFFCAGTPTHRGTLMLLHLLGVSDPADVVELRYRGKGWPGTTTATLRTPRGLEERHLDYEASWGLLTNYKQWRCHVCADHSGEFADVSVGDPWHRPVEPGEPGRSLVLVRTERGRRFLRAAITAGIVSLEPADPAVVPAAQPNLLRGRGAVWGRTLTCRLMGVPTPRYRGFGIFRYFCSMLTPGERIRSFAGTVRRIATRRLRHAQTLEPWMPPMRPTPLTISTADVVTRRTAA